MSCSNRQKAKIDQMQSCEMMTKALSFLLFFVLYTFVPFMRVLCTHFYVRTMKNKVLQKIDEIKILSKTW
jgi:purine-cytosine permease-like protein